MIEKKANLTFTVDTASKQKVDTKVAFSTQDNGTAKLVFSIMKDNINLPLSAAKGRIVMLMADGSKFDDEVKVKDAVRGILEYTLTTEQIRHAGSVTAELFVFYDNNQSMSVAKFGFKIEKSMLDQDIAVTSEYFIKDFADLKSVINEKVDEIEQRTAAVEDKVNSFEEDIAQSTVLQVDAAKKDTTGQTHSDLDSRIKAEVGKITTKQTEFTEALAENVSKTSYIVNVKQPPYNAKGGGVDDTSILQQILNDYPYGCTLVIPDEITIKSIIVPPTFNGEIIGGGTLKALPNTDINRMVDLTNAKNVKFEVNIDMSQTTTTKPSDPRTQIGIYIRNAQNIALNNVIYKNCRVGRPFYISGSSSNNPNLTLDGSKHITVNNNKIFGIHYEEVDEGCYPIIGSDFFGGEGEGVYLKASNGVKIADYTVDTTVSYPATTKYIKINDLYAEKCDRIAILNVDTIEFNNCILEDFWTRGYNFSPTCTNFNVSGGKVTGGDATQLASAYACKNGNFSNVNVYPSGRSTGEKTTLKAYVGCEDITFSNITGVANLDRGIYTHSSKNITFDNVKLKRNSTTVARAVAILSADNATVNFTVKGIKFKNCYLEGNSILDLKSNVGNSKIEEGGITFENCDFNSLADFFYATSEYSNGVGCLFLINNTFKSSGTQSLLPSKIISNFRGNIGLMMKKISTINVSTLSTIHTFPDLYFYIPGYGSGNTAGDADRNPEVTLYKDGIPLIYGVDWFCDGSMATNKMDNRIRLYDSSKVPVGSKLTLIRIS